jgi:hypothetical protein
MTRIVAFLLLLALSGILFAGNTPNAAMNIPQFLAHQERLRQDLQESSKFAHLDNQSKQRIYDSQEVLFTLLRDKNSIGELSDDERLQVFNAQNVIAAVLDDAEADRPICVQAPRLGSHLHNIDCWSKREREAQRDSARHKLIETRPCANEPGCTKGGI